MLAPKALREDLSLLLTASGGSRRSLGRGGITPVSASGFTWPAPESPLFLLGHLSLDLGPP